MNQAELRTLAEHRSATCVSIYMPTHRAGPDVQQDPIRLKNLLTETERRLAAGGLRPPEISRFLAEATALVPQLNFWQSQGDALAVFLAPDFFRYYRLPFLVDELVMVGSRFHLKPMLPLLAPDGAYYVLALSQNRTRVLRASRRSITEVDVPGLPKSLEEALGEEQPEATLQFHTAARGRGEHPGVFHGQGGGGEQDKAEIERYFHRVDHALREWLGPQKAPLVLAGVEYLHPLYREANSYPHLVDVGIKGSPDDLGPEELHGQAWEIVRPIFIAGREGAASLFRRLAGAGDKLASTDLAEIVPAAHYGRVETLFVRLGPKQLGRFDPATGEVVLGERGNGDVEDLYDLAAVQAYLNGGTVFTVTPDKMPSNAPVAAIFRY
jgi:hypothetical protein